MLNLMCIDESERLCERCLGAMQGHMLQREKVQSLLRATCFVLTDTMSRDQTSVQLFCTNWPKISSFL